MFTKVLRSFGMRGRVLTLDAPISGDVIPLSEVNDQTFATVQLEGKHFTVHAQVGDIVHKGDVLIEFDREAIAAEGYDVTVPILVCNSVEFSSIKGSVGVHVEEMDQLIVARER